MKSYFMIDYKIIPFAPVVQVDSSYPGEIRVHSGEHFTITLGGTDASRFVAEYTAWLGGKGSDSSSFPELTKTLYELSDGSSQCLRNVASRCNSSYSTVILRAIADDLEAAGK